MTLVASWGALFLHTAPTETYFLSKGRNFGNTSLSPPTPLVVISYLYFVLTLLVLLILLTCGVVFASIIVHLVAYLDNLFVANPNLLRKAKNW